MNQPIPTPLPQSNRKAAMPPVIVYVDDAGYARQLLAPLRTRGDTTWILVACAPRMTHRISKWVSHSARENWRTRWAEKLFAQMLPWLQADGGQVTTVLAKGPLAELTQQLQADSGAVRVVDARRPKADQAASPPRAGSGTLTGILAGLSALLLLGGD